MKKVLDPKEAQLWFCSKKLMRGEVLSKYVGTNEKTKVIIKITKVTFFESIETSCNINIRDLEFL